MEHLKEKGTTGYRAEWSQCWWAGAQIDNTMISAAKSAIIPKIFVALGFCDLGFTLHAQDRHYATALENSSVCFERYWTGYEAFATTTEQFDYMRTIAIPINLDCHWRMFVVVPEPATGRGRIY